MLDLSSIRKNEPAFAVLRASAGSGKTFSLVRLFLALCLRHDDPLYFRHILAITFTNKAAGEMKERVLKGMLEASKGGGDHLAVLAETLGIAATELARRAGRCHDEMMANYGLLSVMTIDKFVNRLVRSFGRELALDTEFRILLNQDELIGEAVDALMARIGGDDELLTILIERYALQRLDDEKGWDMRRDLKDFGRLLFSEQVAPLLLALDDFPLERFMEVYDTLRTEVGAERAKLEGHANSALQSIANAGVAHEDFSGRGGIVPGYLKKISSGELLNPNSSVFKQAKGEQGLYAQKASEHIKSSIDAIADEVLQDLNVLVDYLSGEPGRVLRLKEALLATLYQLAVLKALRDSIDGVREQRNIMTFNDLNRLIELLVRDNPAPFIYERLGERYKHYLIDEFQDTSIVQWQNFLPLVDESLAKGHYNLLVGDGKQAIYRWRNGDVRQLQKMPEIVGRERTSEMRLREDALRRYLVENYLTDNWRSLNEVVNFNNRLFEGARERLPEALRSIYDEPTQTPKGGAGGWVTATAYSDQKAVVLHELRMEQIVALIERNLALGYRKRDIAILVRDNPVGGRIARHLLGAGIDTVTVESLQLGLHPAPWAVMSLLKWLHNRSDMAAAAWFIQCHRSLMGGNEQSENDFVSRLVAAGDNRTNRIDLEGYLRDEVGIEQPDQLVGMNLYDLVVDLMVKLEVSKRFPAHAEALLQLTFAHQKDANEGIPGLLDLWETEGIKKSIVVPDSIDGVQVMTVHKSKGLEFPVVIHVVGDPPKQASSRLHPVSLNAQVYALPVSVVPLSSLADTAADDQYTDERGRQLLDDLNVVYVGMTRASRHLHILIETSSAENENAAFNAAKITRSIIGELSQGRDLYSEVVEFGEPIPPEKKSEKAATNLKVLSNLVATNARNHLRVSVEGSVREAVSGELTPRQFGNELHALLAGIRHRDDLAGHLAMQWPWQRMGRSSWDELQAVLASVVNFEGAKRWFDPANKAWNERELMIGIGDTVRPDRIVQIDDHLEVVDYKTGAHDKKHAEQVNLYTSVLRRTTGKEVYGFLYYTDRLEVVEVKE